MPTVLTFKTQPITDFLIDYEGLNTLSLILTHIRTVIFWILIWLN